MQKSGVTATAQTSTATVAELRDEFRRGRAVTVTAAAPGRSVVLRKARELVALARRYGYGLDELDQML